MKTAMKVVQVAIDTLVPADYNPRQWSEAEITALDRSLKKFGFVEPILVNSNAKRKNVIVGGHFRCARWAALGNTMVPAVFLDLTEKKERELNVRLNRNTGSFDYRLLKEHFGTRDLIDYGFDVPTLMEENFEVPPDLLPTINGIGAPLLQSGPKPEFQQMTFTLHDSQVKTVVAAIKAAKSSGGKESPVNENSNGNALAFLCAKFIHGKG